MGWFDEQIKQRKQNDRDLFEDSFINIAGSVMGAKISTALNNERQITKDAIDEILKFYHVKSREVPDDIQEMNEQLEYLMRPYGIMRRTVNLEKGWYRDAVGAMLGVRKEDGSVVALIPNGFYGYHFLDRASGKTVKVNRKTAEQFQTEALCFYKPFPLEKIGLSGLMRYIVQTLSAADYVLFGMAAMGVTLLGMLGPKLNNIIFSDIVAGGNKRLLLAMTVFLICVSVSTAIATSIKNLLMMRITTKLNVSVQAAAMMRVLSLPADFFKQYSSGELSNRLQYINDLCDMLVSVGLSTGLTSIFSLVYVSQIFLYAPALVVPALLILLATMLFTVLSALTQIKISKKRMDYAAKESGMSYALISGVQKIKLSGSEKRAFARWGNLYAKGVKLAYNPPFLFKMQSVISMAIALTGNVVIYYAAVKSGVSVADYYAFHIAYGMVSGAFMSLAGIALTLAQIKPAFEMAKPILDTIPEVAAGKRVLTRVSGSIELSNVSFRYCENMPNVIDNLSLKIKPGQYVAIVGATGCGKSTLMRLLLGFETPRKGAVYFDGKDLTTIDLKSLRRKIGVVMQNGKLFQGNLFSNITISAPWLTMDDAWEAAEIAGIADDIRHMPMGMHTMISEGERWCVRGQRQRIMIARAVAPKPKILMLDEATSALDNLTQKKVSDALAGLKCTRIVIAHRLSTIKQCDRIIMLDKGKIAEDGTYEELMEKNGSFAELVKRQQISS